jgi:hypothetical protein
VCVRCVEMWMYVSDVWSVWSVLMCGCMNVCVCECVNVCVRCVEL